MISPLIYSCLSGVAGCCFVALMQYLPQPAGGGEPGISLPPVLLKGVGNVDDAVIVWCIAVGGFVGWVLYIIKEAELMRLRRKWE